MFYDMIKLIVLDVLGIRPAPMAPVQTPTVPPENEDDNQMLSQFKKPPFKDYSWGEDRMGSAAQGGNI